VTRPDDERLGLVWIAVMAAMAGAIVWSLVWTVVLMVRS